MKYKTAKLEDLCTIKTGAPISRAKASAEEGDARDVRVLIPRAMSSGGIIDDDLAVERVGEVKPEFFTRRDDVVIKLSTPYDSAYIDGGHEGILVTSFGMILRAREGAPLSMRYLSMFLNHPQTLSVLQSSSTGMGAGMTVLKRRTVAAISVPLPPMRQQETLAELYLAIGERNREYRRLIELGEELIAAKMFETLSEE